jgi:hypothetical protein
MRSRNGGARLWAVAGGGVMPKARAREGRSNAWRERHGTGDRRGEVGR